MGGTSWKIIMTTGRNSKMTLALNPLTKSGAKITGAPMQAKVTHTLKWSAGWIAEKR
jgi:hypothetical protein